ncbi:MAG: M28 family peptidase [Candidatus Hydrogenedentes bacterium]|nr:M28 family peptidase [Candidatus Hydrogenedentota bacterium]
MKNGVRGAHIIQQMREDVQCLAVEHGRMVGSPGHAQARKYLLGRMRALGLKGYRSKSLQLPYNLDGTDFANLMGALPGSNPALAPVLIAAHYDTCGPFPGADDNAAAVTIMLHAVEPLRAKNLERTILFASFDAEEPPFFLSPAMGSVYFYHHQRKGPVHCAIVLDLVGHDVTVPDLEDLVFITGMESDPDLPGAIRACERIDGVRVMPTLNSYIGDLSDHHAFRLDRRPYLFLSCAHWPHYHAPTDTPEKLNYAKMAALSDYLVELTSQISARDLSGPFEGYDSTEDELYFMRKTIGPLVEAFGIPLEDRASINLVAQTLMAHFGL